MSWHKRGPTAGHVGGRLIPTWFGAWGRDSGINIASQALVTLMTTALAVLIARSLAPNQLGVFYAMFGLSQALAYFVSFGMATWLLRELASRAAGSDQADIDASDGGSLVGAVLGANVVLSAGLLGVSAAAQAVAGQPIETALGLAALMTYSALVAGANVLEAVFRARRQVARVAIINGTEKLLLVAAILCALAQSDSIAVLGLAYVVAGAARYVIDVKMVSREMRIVRPTGSAIRCVLREAAPFGINGALLTIVPRLDILLVAAFTTTGAAYFAIGERIVSATVVIPLAATSALYPFLAGRGMSLRVLAVVAAALGMVGVSVAGPLYSLLPKGLPALFGQSYSPALDAVRLMVCAIPFLFVANALMTSLYSAGLERATVAATSAAMLLGSVFIGLGTLQAGPEGAAAGYLSRQILLVCALAAAAVLCRQADGPDQVDGPDDRSPRPANTNPRLGPQEP